MYDNARMFYTNLLTPLPTASIASYFDTYPGHISGVIKNGSGSATMAAGLIGISTGYKLPDTLLVTVEIDDTSAGKSVGQATYRWRTNQTTPGSWEASGQTTSASSDGLDYDLAITFTAGAGDDFETGDTFYFYATASFSLRNLADMRRDTLAKLIPYAAYKTEPRWDLGSAVQVRVAAVFDPYFEDTPSYFRLKGGTDGSCADYSEDFDLSASPMIIYLDQTYRHWKLEAQFSGEDVMACSQLFLGDYVEFPSGAMYNWGSSERLVSEMPDSALFDYPRRISATRRELTLNWQKVHSDYRSYFDDLYAATRQADDGMEHPVFVHLDPTDDGETLHWMKLVNDLDREWTEYQRDSLTLQFREVAANYAL